jgi:hypothetical protein
MLHVYDYNEQHCWLPHHDLIEFIFSRIQSVAYSISVIIKVIRCCFLPVHIFTLMLADIQGRARTTECECCTEEKEG